MSIYDSLLAVISDFDKNQHQAVRDENDILRLFLPTVTDSKTEDYNIRAEYYAFYMREQLPAVMRAWTGYYDPGLKNGQNGELTPAITHDKITPEIIAYWKDRISKVNNPILKARYSGLVWELSKPATGSKPQLAIAIIHIENLILSCTTKHFSLFTTVFKKLKRALSLATIFKKDELFSQAVAALRIYEKEVGSLDKPGIWKHSYLLLVADKKITVDDSVKGKVISELEDRLKIATTPDSAGKLQINSAEAATELLVQYYADQNRMEDLKRVLSLLDEAYSKDASAKPIQMEHYLYKLHQYYKANNFRAEDEAVLKRMEPLGPAIISEMKPFRSEVTIDQEKINAYIERCLQGSPTEIFYKLAIAFIPDGSPSSDMFGESQIYQSITKGIYDRSGRRVAQVGPVSSDAAGNSQHNIAAMLSVYGAFLHLALQAAMEKGILNTDDIMDYVYASSLIKPDNYEIIRIGVNSFLSGDYITSLHLLIPQIEAGCLNLLEQNGGTRMEDGRSGGYNLKLFSKVLREQIFVDSFGEREAEYFRVLFTESTGWNLRNKVCHGLMAASEFTEQNAERVLVALFHVCIFRFADQEESAHGEGEGTEN